MDIIFYIAIGLLKVLHFIAHPFYLYHSRGKRKTLRPFRNDLLRISATELADKIRTKEIKSEEICSLYIDRIKEVEPYLNAVIEDRFPLALDEAKQIDELISSADATTIENIKNTQPLLGVPFTVKESCALNGMSYAVGSLTRHGYKCEEDGEIVKLLKKSGAIALLVSNTPELCLSWESFNLIKGCTNNPYDTTRTSAGSSGGEGALLGSGASLIGIGSDIAGSIRVPALFNGVFGHKPTRRIASIKGHYPYCADERYADYLVIGPMTRYAKDLKTMMKIIVKEELRNELNLDQQVEVRKLNVFVMEDCGSNLAVPAVEKSIKDIVNRAAKYLGKECGCKIIHDEDFQVLSSSVEVCGSVLYQIRDIPNVLKGKKQSLFVETIKSLMGRSQYSINVLAFYIVQNIYKHFVNDYTVKNEELRKLFINKLGNNGVLLYPTWTNTANKHHEFYFCLASIMYVMLANTLGLPATHVPCGFDKKGMPIGVQVIAAPGQDRLCLAVAEELEKGFGGWVPPS